MKKDSWGHKYNISLYVEGPIDTSVFDKLEGILDLLSEAVDSDFMGITSEVVEKSPKDQIAS